MEERLKLVEQILKECECYVSFVKAFGNECVATDSVARAVNNIKKLAADIKEFDISESN